MYMEHWYNDADKEYPKNVKKSMSHYCVFHHKYTDWPEV